MPHELTRRRTVRDEFDTKKDDLEKQLTELLGGVKWTIDFNAAAVWVYAPDGSYPKERLGTAFYK